ncbi:MAG TPA: tyrosine-type recombinase/integrase [Bacteroidia bacterium]|nr:tyrosine-type recombinase/integrase [Bacteroidia bacterium]
MKTIQEAAKAFLFHCHYEKKLSPKTLKAYSIDCEQFLSFLGKEKSQEKIGIIDKHILKEFLHHLQTMKPKTLKRKVATIKAMFNFLEFEDEIIVNPFRKLKIKIKEPKMLPSVMSLPEVQKILNLASVQIKKITRKKSYEYLESLRHLAVLEILFATGTRVSEMCYLKCEDIDLESGLIRIMGKGSRQRSIQICHPEVLKILRAYHLLTQKRFNTTEYFFINRLGKRLSDQSVRFMIEKYSSEAGISKRITPHTFRHSFATLLLEQNVDIKYIQTLLGHSSISTTQIYTHVNSTKQREILLHHHPRQFIQMN